MNITKALFSLRPDAEWVLRGETYDGIEWLDAKQTKPTEDELEAEIVRLQAEFDNTQYQRIRATQYPKIADQLDMLWHAIDSGSLDKDSDFYKSLKAVKDANPKG